MWKNRCKGGSLCVEGESFHLDECRHLRVASRSAIASVSSPAVSVQVLAEPSEGVFFVVRLPNGWQLCTFRHDDYGPIGLPDCWVQVLEPFLTIWLAKLEADCGTNFKTKYGALESELGMLVAGYDAFPRGEIRRNPLTDRYEVHHGGELTRKMQISRREIEEAFGIHGMAKWVEDPSHISDHLSARRLRGLLPISEVWEDS